MTLGKQNSKVETSQTYAALQSAAFFSQYSLNSEGFFGRFQSPRSFSWALNTFLFKTKLQSQRRVPSVLFGFLADRPNYLGAAKLLASSLKEVGIQSTYLADASRATHASITNWPEAGRVVVPGIKRIERLELSPVPGLDLPSKLDIQNPMVEGYVSSLIRQGCALGELIARDPPRMFISMFPWHPVDTIGKIAADRVGIPTMYIPHGHPIKPCGLQQFDYVCGWSEELIRYMSSISKPGATCLKIPWPESFSMRDEQKLSRAARPPGHSVLFLSQLHGAALHNCPSLESLLRESVEAFLKSKSVATVVVRAAPNDDASSIRRMFAGKVEVTEGTPLNQDMAKATCIASVSSTALLAASVLEKTAVEVRNTEVNEIWPVTVLPAPWMLHGGKLKDSDIVDHHLIKRGTVSDFLYKDFDEVLEAICN